MASPWSGWTLHHTAPPCWAGWFACPGGKTGVSLHTRPRLLRYLPLPCAPWSSGPGSSPGGAAPRPAADRPVVVLFLSHWLPGLCHHGPRTGSHAASEPPTDNRHFHELLEINNAPLCEYDIIFWSEEDIFWKIRANILWQCWIQPMNGLQTVLGVIHWRWQMNEIQVNKEN